MSHHFDQTRVERPHQCRKNHSKFGEQTHAQIVWSFRILRCCGHQPAKTPKRQPANQPTSQPANNTTWRTRRKYAGVCVCVTGSVSRTSWIPIGSFLVHALLGKSIFLRRDKTDPLSGSVMSKFIDNSHPISHP